MFSAIYYITTVADCLGVRVVSFYEEDFIIYYAGGDENQDIL